MEGVLAAFAQFDNDVRSDRTRAGMKAALELGRWVFLAPIGYLNAPRSMGKSLIHDSERAPLVRRAFENYATGQYTKRTTAETGQDWGLTNRRGRPLTSQAIGMLRRNQLYAGIVDIPRTGVPREAWRLRAADFRGLVRSEERMACRAVARSERSGPPSRLRRLTRHPSPWLAEPKLTLRR